MCCNVTIFGLLVPPFEGGIKGDDLRFILPLCPPPKGEVYN